MNIEELIKLVSQYIYDLGASRVFLFGSFAKNNSHKTSDIDICFDFNGAPLNDKELLELVLWIQNLPTVRKIDLVDFNYSIQKDLKEEILINGILLEKI